jgi:competence ComEA-like helix-hairpin-helix protein
MSPKVGTFALAGCVWLAAIQSVAGPSVFAEARVQESQADDAGAALLARMCNRCHESARIVEKRRVRSDWQDVLLKMIEKGAEGGEQDFEALFAYLVVTYGQIYINQAPPDEMVAVLGVTPSEAEAIAKYRAANGSFADFNAILKVPGVNASTLEKHKGAVVF